MRHLGTNRGRESEAHRAETAGGDPGTRLVELVILSGPHLVLANVSRYNRFTLCRIVQHFDNPLRLQHRI